MDIENIPATGGFDCPELAFTGMLRGFEIFPNTGSMFVFTDASPKDATPDNIINVIGLAKTFDIKISFFTVTNRRCDGKPLDYSKFEVVAAETGGKIKPVNLLIFISSLNFEMLFTWN